MAQSVTDALNCEHDDIAKLSQVFLALRYFSSQYPDAFPYTQTLSAWETKLTDIHKQNAENGQPMTQLQRNATDFIAQYYLNCQTEVLFNSLPVDIFIPGEDLVVAIDGPTHSLHYRSPLGVSSYIRTPKDLFHDTILQLGNSCKIAHYSFFAAQRFQQNQNPKEHYAYWKDLLQQQAIIIPQFEQRWTLVGRHGHMFNKKRRQAQPSQPATKIPSPDTVVTSHQW